MLAGSTFSSTLLFERSSLFQVRVEENFGNCPRTVVTTMCLTEKPTVLWFGSASSVTGAATSAAARTSVIVSNLLGKVRQSARLATPIPDSRRKRDTPPAPVRRTYGRSL